jgi:hypothetical protein
MSGVKSTNKIKPALTAWKAKREAMLFSSYFLMQPRSLKLLRLALNAAGVKVSESTLYTYSADFNWQERCKELDEKFKGEREQRVLDKVVEMNQRQIRLGRNMQLVGGTALRFLQGQKLSANEISTLVKQGVQIERLASGQATSRAEVVQSLQNQVIKELSVLFVQVNQLEDPSERTKRFALGADRVMQQFLLAESND